jgi:MtN3 and saliva related transmembrane protein
MLYQDFISTLALVTSIIGFAPQIYKTWQLKSADEISLLMIINYLICSLAWILYALHDSIMLVLYTNLLCLISAIILLIQKILYAK